MAADDKMKNTAEDLEGKAKEAAGKARGDEQQENEGKGQQAKADLKKAAENVKDAFKK
ncbi:CsbD-like protein [Mumia flava]|uniref:CsbD-like protein n=1 Tax=Mumia flava TaxID=1348852 RepID=A0A2M9BD70_9ACTN|nr:CsbD family protein [Mumia flava]PJJ55882.1 CsbD-like protein [Mumia flava]